MLNDVVAHVIMWLLAMGGGMELSGCGVMGVLEPGLVNMRL